MKLVPSAYELALKALIFVLFSAFCVQADDNFSLDREQKREIQTILNELGYDVGSVDGQLDLKQQNSSKSFVQSIR